MSIFSKRNHSRIGTCRSGIPFDIPHYLETDEAVQYLSAFCIDDQIDMFCMCEAKIVPLQHADFLDGGYSSVEMLNRYFWKHETIAMLRPHLDALGLRMSPAYVNFGQVMLLV